MCKSSSKDWYYYEKMLPLFGKQNDKALMISDH